jgi:photosystem II stability/assembly factor-like uncharacterized protein
MKIAISFLALIYSITLCSQSWHEIPSGTSNHLTCISFANSSIGYIGGMDSLLLKSTDGGKSWSRQALNIPMGFTKDVIDLFFETELKGYALTGPYGGLYKTIDGGLTWTSDSINQTNMCFKRSIEFTDLENGFIGGSMCFQGESLSKKSNNNWDSIQNIGSWNADDQISNFNFYNSQFGLASATSNSIYRTTDGGDSWSSASAFVDTLGTSDIVVINDTLAYATHPNTGANGVLISTDGGLNWNPDISSLTFFYPGFNSATKDDVDNIYFGGFPSFGQKGFILWKNSTWWIYEEVSQSINDIETMVDTIIFAVGDSGLIVCNTPLASIGSEENKVDPFNAYPNPFFNEILVSNLQFDVERILLMNSLGIVIRSYYPKNESIQIEASDLPSGTYFLKCSKGDEIEIIKVIKL